MGTDRHMWRCLLSVAAIAIKRDGMY